MAADDSDGPGDVTSGESYSRDESEAERLDRNFEELLQELRVAQTGVQILFAFLLTLAFTQRFAQVTDFERNLYVVILLLAALAAALIIAPVSYHRIVFRQGRRDELVQASNRLALAGLVVLMFAMTGAVLLIVHVVLGSTWGVWLAGGTILVFLLLWFVVPIASRRRHG